MARKLLTPALVLIAVFLSHSVFARDLQQTNESSLQVSRYITLEPGPTNAQRNPLKVVFPNIIFSAKIKSVGQAIQFLLKDTGYHLAKHHPDKRVLKMFRLPLPKIHRRMGPLTLAQALETLSGEPWQLSVDPINRLISFQLPDYFQRALQLKFKKTPVKTLHTQHKKQQRVNVKNRVVKKRTNFKRKLVWSVKPSKARINTAKRVHKKPRVNNNVLTMADIPAALR